MNVAIFLFIVIQIDCNYAAKLRIILICVYKIGYFFLKKLIISGYMGSRVACPTSGRIAHYDWSWGLERLYVWPLTSIRSQPCLLTAPTLRRSPLHYGEGQGVGLSFDAAKVQHFFDLCNSKMGKRHANRDKRAFFEKLTVRCRQKRLPWIQKFRNSEFSFFRSR